MVPERARNPPHGEEPADGRSANVVWSPSQINRDERAAALGHRGATLWMTGLPASGKSTLAVAVEHRLVGAGRPAYRLDGDNLRHGLNGDLGFSAEARSENVRRTAHVASLLADGGFVVVVGLVSPYRSDRELARAVHVRMGLPFIEVFVDTPLQECERRDPKGLYAKARAGELTGFTGVDDPYEPPLDPALVLSTVECDVEELVQKTVTLLNRTTGT